MMTRHKMLQLALLAALAWILTGCAGGSDASEATVLVPMNKYSKKADMICSNASYEQGEIAQVYFKSHPGATEVDLVLPAAVPPLEKMLKELHELGLPKGHEEEAEVFLAEAEKDLEALKRKPSGALSEQHNPFEKANQLGEKLGLGDCSRNP